MKLGRLGAVGVVLSFCLLLLAWDSEGAQKKIPFPDIPRIDKKELKKLLGKPTARLETVKKQDLARLTQEGWEKERTKMVKTCARCHSIAFAQGELKKGDRMIREADIVMAETIRIVAGLYKDGVLKKPGSYARPYPDLLTFHDAPSPIETKLFLMFSKYRMRTFQGTFHANPDYALWYGWSKMQQELTEIRAMAEDLRAKARDKKKASQ